MSHIGQEFEKKCLAYRNTYQELVGDELTAERLREKCVNDNVRNMIVTSRISRNCWKLQTCAMRDLIIT
jgi:hypothetical protein